MLALQSILTYPPPQDATQAFVAWLYQWERTGVFGMLFNAVAIIAVSSLLFTDSVPLDYNDWEHFALLHFLTHLQCYLCCLQPSHQPLLDHGERIINS